MTSEPWLRIPVGLTLASAGRITCLAPYHDPSKLPAEIFPTRGTVSIGNSLDMKQQSPARKSRNDAPAISGALHPEAFDDPHV
jgi:hypothetical protein